MKKECKKVVSLAMVTLLIAGCLVLLGSCGRISEGSKKLYDALLEGNYQGAVEALRDYDDIDLEHLGIKEDTWFSESDDRALGLVSDNPKFVSLLIDAGADVNNVLEGGYSYLYFNESLEALQIYVKAGIDVNQKDENGNTPLCYVFDMMNTSKKETVWECIHCLLEAGAVPDSRFLETCLNCQDGPVFAKDILELVQDAGQDTGIGEALECAISGDNQGLQDAVKAKKYDENEIFYIAEYAAAHCDAETLKFLRNSGFAFEEFDEAEEMEFFGTVSSLLQVALRYNDVEAVKYLVQSGCSLEEFYIEDALYGGKEANVEYLQKMGFEIQKDEYLWSLACSSGNRDSIRILLENGYKPTDDEIVDGYYFSGDNDETFDALLEFGIPFDVEDKAGDTPLVKLCSEDQEKAKRLLELGAAVDAKAIWEAIFWDFDELAEEMIAKCDDVDSLPRSEFYSPLTAAVAMGNFDMVKLLVEEKHVDINRIFNYGGFDEDSAMHDAAGYSSEDILKYLIDKGGDTQLKTENGETPMDAAIESGYEANVRILEGK